MTLLLHLDSSANRRGNSVSRRLSALFCDTWRSACEQTDYRYRDLAADPVPPIDTAYCALGRRVERRGLLPLADIVALADSPGERQQWALTHPLIAELLAADTVVIGAPMYNYSVPAALKAWIDRVSFPGAFRDPVGGGSLLQRTRVVVISARGGAYGPGTAREGWDFQTPYLRAYFRKQGVADENVHFVSAEMTLAGLVPHLTHLRPAAASSLCAVRAQVIDLATAAAGSATRGRGDTETSPGVHPRRVNVASQLTSHISPASVENDCSQRGWSVSVSDHR